MSTRGSGGSTSVFDGISKGEVSATTGAQHPYISVGHHDGKGSAIMRLVA